MNKVQPVLAKIEYPINGRQEILFVPRSGRRMVAQRWREVEDAPQAGTSGTLGNHGTVSQSPRSG